MTTPQDALPAPASGEIAVTISLPWTIGVSIKPNVLLDGVRMVNAAGRNVYPVAPGRHMLSCEVNVSGSTFGQGDIAVDVQPGAVSYTHLDVYKRQDVFCIRASPYWRRARSPGLVLARLVWSR